MDKQSNRIPVKGQLCTAAFLVVLLIGAWLGSLFILFFPDAFDAQVGSVFFSGAFINMEQGWLSAFSAFLFDSLFYLLLVFLFGMTFLGVAVVPLTVLFKGFTLGASLTALLVLEGTGSFFRSWITYLPATSLCTVVFVIFSGRAYGVSRKACRFLFNGESAAISLKSFGAHFLAALALLLMVSVLNSALGFLAAILF